ncbi:hypothetical protein [Rhodanobacter sp. C03]|uniref:hypothetical protein n=1 Tax=Rhodanobacter sp. C03 TaxID=1945858 RepID=UPI0009853D4D|nr:hypothetical protein [Rhodanobacter sp. C03]OOG60034.1 hypothetical protein B0E48_04515 [Rhodanobacter sp. C03]
MKLVLLAAWFVAIPMLAAAGQTIQTPAPITSTEALARYLRDTPAGDSPLDKLPTGAKKRFLSSLEFGSKGLGGFDTSDLQAELDDAQIHQVLLLFGAESYASQLHGAPSAHRTCAIPSDCPESRIERRFDRLNELEHSLDRQRIPDQEKGRKLASAYRKLFAAEQTPDELKIVSNSDLKLLYRAADTASLWSSEAVFLRDMASDHDELQRRGMTTAADVMRLHAKLVTKRQFAEADALASKYPAAELRPLPALQDRVKPNHQGPTLLTVNPLGTVMQRRPFDIDAPVQIVVVAGCHFAADAARDIHADPALDRIFKQHAIWLGSQNEKLGDVSEWNREHPGQPMNIAWQDSEWSMLDSWAMPTFYIFQHGKLVNKFSGWSHETEPRQLRAALHQVGLLDQ